MILVVNLFLLRIRGFDDGTAVLLHMGLKIFANLLQVSPRILHLNRLHR